MNTMSNLGFSRKGEERNEEGRLDGVKFTDRYAREEGETRIYNLIILDESGSMTDIAREALSGANETIQTIRAAQQENPDDHQMLAFVTFDSGDRRPDVRVLIDCEKIENVKDLTEEQYSPYGCTPLYDAMGASFTALKEVVKEGDHVLVTVITDGYENSSRHYNAARIKALVESLTAKGWVFTYIGANQDSERTAGGLGIRSSMDFQVSVSGSAMMWRKHQSGSHEFYKKVRRQKVTGEDIDMYEDFYAQKQTGRRITPRHIETLQEGQVFVFGSNEAGHHDGGAARFALEHFGAVYGQGVGLQGQSYAIPTMGLPLEKIARYVDEFVQFADIHPDMTFLVTRIGCGIAGFDDSEIAPLFARAYSLPNVCLPEEFWRELNYKY